MRAREHKKNPSEFKEVLSAKQQSMRREEGLKKGEEKVEGAIIKAEK